MSRRWELKLPYLAPPLSLNARLHRMAVYRQTQRIYEEVGWLVLHAKLPALDHAWIWLEWTPAVARRRDTDNLEPTRKAVIDGIVRAGRLPDDTPEFVTRPENVIQPPKPPGLLLAVIADTDPTGVLA